MDMETSDEEEEDGQFTKFDEEEERDRKLFSKIAPEEDQPMTIDDLNKCRLTRDLIAKHCMTPWFDEYVKGMGFLLRLRYIPIQLSCRGLGSVPYSRGRCRCIPDMRGPRHVGPFRSDHLSLIRLQSCRPTS